MKRLAPSGPSWAFRELPEEWEEEEVVVVVGVVEVGEQSIFCDSWAPKHQQKQIIREIGDCLKEENFKG